MMSAERKTSPGTPRARQRATIVSDTTIERTEIGIGAAGAVTTAPAPTRVPAKVSTFTRWPAVRPPAFQPQPTYSELADRVRQLEQALRGALRFSARQTVRLVHVRRDLALSESARKHAQCTLADALADLCVRDRKEARLDRAFDRAARAITGCSATELAAQLADEVSR